MRPHRRRSLGLLALALVAPALPAPRGGELRAQAAYEDGRGDFSIALTGDAIITRRLSPYREPEFLRLREIIQSADAAFTNLEILFHEFGECPVPDVIPASQSGGTYMGADPEMAKELAWMGFDLVSRANNHGGDYGIGGMRATTRAVEAAGLVHAGVGENLALARAPGYLETPGGRVALISVATTFADHMRAGPQRKDLRGRAGLNPVRHTTTYFVPRNRLDELGAIASELGLRGPEGGDRLRFAGATFVAGDRPRITTEPDEGDVEEVLESVRDAKRQANWVIVSSHSHESSPESRDVAAEFVHTLARAVVDAGADVFVGHGPHRLRGIEIRGGRPIFYSLGDFIFQNETVEFQPEDNYEEYDLHPHALPSEFYDARNERGGGGFPANPLAWEGAVATVVFREDRLAEIRLHPVTMGHGLDRPQRGRPMLATGALGRKIIDDLQRLSEPYGTRVEEVDGMGLIRVESAATSGR